MPEGWSEAGGLGGDVDVRCHEALAQDGRGVGGQLASGGPAGHRRRDAVELVEQPGDGVAPRVELDGAARPVAQEQEPQQLRWQQVGDAMRRGARPLGGGHLAPADVEELVQDVEWRLAMEDLARDGVAPVARPARGAQVLAAALHRDAEQAPLGRPIHVEGQLDAAGPRHDAPGVPAALRPCHVIGLAGVRHGGAIPVGGERGADLAAVLADDRERQPVGLLGDLGDLPVQLPDALRAMLRVQLAPQDVARFMSLAA